MGNTSAKIRARKPKKNRLRLKKSTDVNDGTKTSLGQHTDHLGKFKTQREYQGTHEPLAINPHDYVVNENLIGADSFSLKEVRCLRAPDVVAPPSRNQLVKNCIRNEDRIIQLLNKYADGSRWYTWISATLPADMDLSVAFDVPCEVVQAFFIGERFPPFVLTLHDGPEEIDQQVQHYADETVRQLRHRLLDYCSVDFLLLPCVLRTTLEVDSLDMEIGNLKKEICKHRHEQSTLFGGEVPLSRDSLDAINAAAVASSRCSVLPCLLMQTENEEQLCPDLSTHWYVQMESDWACFLSRVIEVLDKDEYVISYPPSAELKVRAAVLEAAKRLSIVKPVVIRTEDEQLLRCIEELREHADATDCVDLKLSTDANTDSTYIIYLDGEEMDAERNTQDLTTDANLKRKKPLDDHKPVAKTLDDPNARLIEEEFVSQVDPEKLLTYLHHNILTRHEEKKICAKQKKYGRASAARMLLVQISREEGWITKLQKALRDHHMRLDSIADSLDQLQEIGKNDSAFPDQTVCPELPQPDGLHKHAKIQDDFASKSVTSDENKHCTSCNGGNRWNGDQDDEQPETFVSPIAPSVVQHGVNEPQNTLSVIEVGKRTNEEVIRDILPRCAEDQLDVVLDNLVNRRLWKAVSLVLSRQISPSQRVLAIEQAARLADEPSLVSFILPHCHDDELDSVLKQLVLRGMWKAIPQVLCRGVNETLRRYALNEASALADEEDVKRYILPCCCTDEVISVLNYLVKRGMWRQVSVVLRRGVRDAQVTWVVIQAAAKANREQFIRYIVPYCPDDQLDFVLAQVIEHGQWQRVGALLKEQQTCSQTQENGAATGKVQRQNNLDLSSPHKQKDRILAECVFREYWRSVLAILRQGVSEEVQNWTVVHAARRCKLEQVLLEVLNYTKEDDLPKVIVTLFFRNRMETASRLLQVFPVGSFGKNLREPTATKRFKKHQNFDERFKKLQKELLCFITLLDNVIDRVKESKFRYAENGRISSETEIGFIDESDARSPSSTRSKQRFVNALMQSFISESVDKCIVALLAFAPFMPYLQRASLEQLLKANDLKLLSLLSGLDMPEETRRWLFMTAVQQKLWDLVIQLGDHTLYDDLRTIAINEAVGCERWDVALSLTDSGLTMLELKRLHRHVAMYADWNTVLKLFDRGADISDIISALQCTIKMPRKIRSNGNVQERCQELLILESMLRKQAKSESRRCTWRVEFYRLKCCPDENKIPELVEKAMQNDDWHIVVNLLRRVAITDSMRNSLFSKMLRRRRWDVCRVLLEQKVEPTLCLKALDELMENKQWSLVARVMKYDVGDTIRKDVLEAALKQQEGTVVCHCIKSLQQCLSLEEREVVFHEALASHTWEALKPLVMQKDETGLRHLKKTMIEAVKRNQWDMVDHCMSLNADKIQVDQTLSSVFLAAELRDWERVQHFVERDFIPLVQKAQGDSLLHMAICDQAWTTVKVLIKHNGKTIHQPDHCGRTPLTMLIDACQGEVLEFALDFCRDLHTGVNKEGETALHAVCLSGCWRAVYYLVARGVDPLAVTEHGHSALMYAVQNKENPQRIVAECIQQGFSTHQPHINDSFTGNNSPFQYAVLKDMPIVAQMLYESGACSYQDLFGMSERLSAQSKGYCIEFTKKVAKTPRRLESTCRLVISHSLNVLRKRHKEVKRLPLSPSLRKYVMFSELTNPLYGFDTTWWNAVQM